MYYYNFFFSATKIMLNWNIFLLKNSQNMSDDLGIKINASVGNIFLN